MNFNWKYSINLFEEGRTQKRENMMTVMQFWIWWCFRKIPSYPFFESLISFYSFLGFSFSFACFTSSRQTLCALLQDIERIWIFYNRYFSFLCISLFSCQSWKMSWSTHLEKTFLLDLVPCVFSFHWRFYGEKAFRGPFQFNRPNKNASYDSDTDLISWLKKTFQLLTYDTMHTWLFKGAVS